MYLAPTLKLVFCFWPQTPGHFLLSRQGDLSKLQIWPRFFLLETFPWLPTAFGVLVSHCAWTIRLMICYSSGLPSVAPYLKLGILCPHQTVQSSLNTVYHAVYLPLALLMQSVWNALPLPFPSETLLFLFLAFGMGITPSRTPPVTTSCELPEGKD